MTTMFPHQSEMERIAVAVWEEAHEQDVRDTDCPDLSPVSWLMPRLLRLVADHQDQPVHLLRPTIQQLLLEQCYSGDCGDMAHDNDAEAEAEAMAQRLVLVLEAARHIVDREEHRR